MTLSRPKEAALLEASTRLFRQRGFHATSMQDLAEALGMNRGSLYHYIESKDDLLWSIVSGALAGLDAEVRPALSDPTCAPADRIAAGVRAHLRFAARERDALSLLQIELRALPDERHDELLERRDEYEALWRATVADGIGRGEFRDVDVRLATITLLAACNWFVQWFRPDGELTVDEIAAQLTNLFFSGLTRCVPDSEVPR